MAIGEKNGWKSTEYRLKGESIEEIAARSTAANGVR